MKLDDARRWHKQLYEEILLEEVRQPESRDEASEYTGQEAATRVLVPDHEGPEY